ncbi:hypothetical protein [Sediminibacterium sp. KACHI17]|jgi:hypothetical protein|uniref:hypothetical protein n=1 Tax=Sediminibacterium sp. KACHI17 TaxID=1751071 RepID=UPI003365503B
MRKPVVFLFIISVLLIQSCKKEASTVVLSGPVGINDNRNVGASAAELLASDNYTSLTVEVQYSPGMQLQEQTFTNLQSFLEQRLNKPGGITLQRKQVASIGKPVVSIADITSFTDQNRTAYTDGNRITVYVYIADANFDKDNVVGVAYRNTAICLFGKTIQSNSGGINQASRVKVESGVLLHEIGHLLGLVNNGTGMVTPHEDGDNRAHCTNTNCLMYYTIETTGLMNMLNNAIPQLDANCINDLRANGGK